MSKAVTISCPPAPALTPLSKVSRLQRQGQLCESALAQRWLSSCFQSKVIHHESCRLKNFKRIVTKESLVMNIPEILLIEDLGFWAQKSQGDNYKYTSAHRRSECLQLTRPGAVNRILKATGLRDEAGPKERAALPLSTQASRKSALTCNCFIKKRCSISTGS